VTMWEGVGSLWTHHSAVPLGTAGGARPAVETSTGLLRVAHVAYPPPPPPPTLRVRSASASATIVPVLLYTHTCTHTRQSRRQCLHHRNEARRQ
jgi:hypothetical protein